VCNVREPSNDAAEEPDSRRLKVSSASTVLSFRHPSPGGKLSGSGPQNSTHSPATPGGQVVRV
jgi:hypothetical protein